MEILAVYVLKTLLLPPASLLLLAFFGLAIARRRERLGRAVLSLALLALVVLSLPFTASRLVALLPSWPALDAVTIANSHAQAIVILGGGLRGPAPEYGLARDVRAETLQRLRYGARLARLSGLPILVSGGRVFGGEQPAEADIMARVLEEDFGVTVRWRETQSRNTAENARYSGQILARDGISRVLLVTHALHMPRALEQFRTTGLEVIPAPTVLPGANEPPGVLDFLPSAAGLYDSAEVLHEALGRLWYRWRYRQ